MKFCQRLRTLLTHSDAGLKIIATNVTPYNWANILSQHPNVVVAISDKRHNYFLRLLHKTLIFLCLVACRVELPFRWKFSSAISFQVSTVYAFLLPQLIYSRFDFPIFFAFYMWLQCLWVLRIDYSPCICFSNFISQSTLYLKLSPFLCLASSGLQFVFVSPRAEVFDHFWH